MSRPPDRSSKLIPFAKIGDNAVRRIVQGFACAESIAEIAAATGVSEKTCRSVVLALRYRLFRPSFNQWRIHWDMALALEIDAQPLINALIYSYYARCYFNRRCYTNYQQGRRKDRLCRSCPIPLLDETDDDLSPDLRFIDLIHDFYGMLGIGGERGLLPLTIFRLRFAHTAVVQHAYENSRKNEDMSPDFDDRRSGTARALYETLIRDLEADPLVRAKGPIDAMDEEYGDLTWLDQ